ncbi:MAG: hypothetical protein IID16_07820 [Candidatus Marinimicrobia bacterium]|nr:hypothetical protein [Candidatus Neomarinimicrobiota bacterium]
MRTLKQIIPVVSFFLFFSMCTEDKNSSDTDDLISQGTHRYIAYDSTGVTIVDGFLTIIFEGSNQLGGEWQLDAVGDPQNIGLQVGEGWLIGTVNQDTIWINLNPDWDDNNVYLDGILQDSSFSGQWTWAGFPGVFNYGTFIAEAQ